MDCHNLHHFWGFSGSLDMLDEMSCTKIRGAANAKCSLLQVAPYDLRHTLTTVCRSARRELNEPIHLYIYEDNPEALARHLLLLAIFLDSSLERCTKMQRFVEVFGNHFLREDTFEYVKMKCRELERFLSYKIAQDGRCGNTILDQLLDISLLRYDAKDAVLQALVQTRSSNQLDMRSAWDCRCRKWYCERYDFRKNMVDWDYHMRLLDGHAVPAPKSIIHFSHFRHWRMTGLAFEVRDCQYNKPNQSLFSTATGRTKEFKDRNGKDVGRSVAAYGLWSDILCSPYHSFGTACEDASYFQVSNRAFKRTAVDVTERNVLALLHELYTGQMAQDSDIGGGFIHRSRPARGPTTAEDLKEAIQADTSQPRSAESTSSVNLPEKASSLACEADRIAQPACSTTAMAAKLQEEYRPEKLEKLGPTSSLDQNLGYCEGQHEQCSDRHTASTPAVDIPGIAEAKHEAYAKAQEDAHTIMKTTAEGSLRRFKIFLVTGDFVKQLAGRRALAGTFSGATVGVMHAHLLRKSHCLAGLMAPGARVLVESAQNVLQVPKEQLPAFHEKVSEWASEGGLAREHLNVGKQTDVTSTADHIAFVKPLEPLGG